MLSAAGVGSGIDIDGLVAQLMQLESRPVNRLTSKKADVTLEISNIGQVRSAMSGLGKAAEALADVDALNAFSAASTDENVLSVSTSAAANAAGSYSIVVDHLAAANRYRSAVFAEQTTAVGTGTLTLSVGAESFDLVVDGTNNTLSGLRDAINGAANNPGVNATVMVGDDGARLLLTAAKTGLDNAVMVTADAGLSGLAMAEVSAALDSQLTIDGVQVTRPDNVIAGAIDGLTFTAYAPGAAFVSVASDSASFQEKMEDFVNAYNSLHEQFGALRAGPMGPDSLLLSVESGLRNQLFTQRGQAASGVTLPTDVGIEFNDTGMLVFDTDKVSAALSNNRTAVLDFLSNTDHGLAISINNFLDGYAKTDGVLDSRVGTLDDAIHTLDQRIEAAQYRLTRTEARLRQQFTAMDQVVAKFQSTSNYLVQQFANFNQS